MNASPDNQPQTPANPVEGGMRDVIQCLTDWLKENGPSEQKAHRILSALAAESLKKADYRDDQRLFTADELMEAAGEGPKMNKKTPNDWLDWKGTVEKYWEARKEQVIRLARKRGLRCYPELKRNSPKGRHKATYGIGAAPIPEDTSGLETMGSLETSDRIYYERSAPGEVDLIWWAQPIFREGKYRMTGWRRWLIVSWVVGFIAFVTLFVIAIYLGFIMPMPVTTREIASLIAMIGLPFWAWLDVVKPWFRLLDDRIAVASVSFLAWAEKPAQIEIFQEEDERVIRFVRYTATCLHCGASVYVDDGSPDFPRRLVGRCSESPREHVYSFDRVTLRGAVLRCPPRP